MHSRLFISNNNNNTIFDNVKECLHVHSRLLISKLVFWSCIYMYRWVYECIVCICAYVWVYVCIYIYVYKCVYIRVIVR